MNGWMDVLIIVVGLIYHYKEKKRRKNDKNQFDMRL